MPLFLTYDNKSLQDGLGAQALRILGVFSIAKFLRLKYLHTPIVGVIEEFAHKFDSGTSSDALIATANDFFLLPGSQIDVNKPVQVIKVANPSIRQLIRFSIKYRFSQSNIIMEILFPFSILNRFPSIYYLGVRVMRKRHAVLINQRPNHQVVAHVRWGYGWKYANQNFVRNRHLPFSYFTKILPIIARTFLGDEPCKILVHTDLSPLNISWQPTQERVLRERAEVTKSDSAKSIEIEGYNLEELIVFPEGSSHRIAYCAPFFETFLDMCGAKVLVMGTSAFSYLAGLLNDNVVIWPSSHGHARFPRWISSKDLGVTVQKDEMFRG